MLDKPDPFDGTGRILALATRIPGGVQQVLLLVVAQRPDADARLRGDLSDPHPGLLTRLHVSLAPDVGVRF